MSRNAETLLAGQKKLRGSLPASLELILRLSKHFLAEAMKYGDAPACRGHNITPGRSSGAVQGLGFSPASALSLMLDGNMAHSDLMKVKSWH